MTAKQLTLIEFKSNMQTLTISCTRSNFNFWNLPIEIAVQTFFENNNFSLYPRIKLKQVTVLFVFTDTLTDVWGDKSFPVIEGLKC